MKTEQPPSALTAGSNGSNEHQILKARARALARPPESLKHTEAAIEVVEFGLAQERYALPTAAVREVFPLKDLTPLPCTPPFIVGVINVRGQILPVIDIKKFFDLPQQGITDLHKVIIVHHDEMDLGILADVVFGVRAIPLNTLQPSLPTLTGIREEYLRGVTAERLVVLDVIKILADPRIIVQEEVET
ncbi:MAG: chemotaxis protein CheW [Candidatus Binatia bacterium]